MHDLSSAATDWKSVLANAAPWLPISERLLVVVPHPDDEAVMFGGLIAFAARSGTVVDVLAVTDGEAAYPEWTPPHDLAALRRREQAAAAEDLGLDPSTTVRLGLPDGGVAEWEEQLSDTIATHVNARDIDLLVAPWEHDHHTDHEACGRAARRAVDRSRRPITTAFGLFWALLREQPPVGVDFCAMELTTWEMRRKRSAINRHVSQITSLVAERPMLGEPELAVTRLHREPYLVTAR